MTLKVHENKLGSELNGAHQSLVSNDDGDFLAKTINITKERHSRCQILAKIYVYKQLNVEQIVVTYCPQTTRQSYYK